MPSPFRGRPSEPPTTPLAAYLATKRMTRAAFAERCARVAGVAVARQLVQRWASGAAKPRNQSRHLIERASRGEVPASAWEARRLKRTA